MAASAVLTFVVFITFDVCGDLINFLREAQVAPSSKPCSPILHRLYLDDGHAAEFLRDFASAAPVPCGRRREILRRMRSVARNGSFRCISCWSICSLCRLRPPGWWRAAQGLAPDTFVLMLPMLAGAEALTLIAFVGGLSAATAMVIVEELVALSIMICNGLVTPVLLRQQFADVGEQGDMAGPLLSSGGWPSSRSCLSGTGFTNRSLNRTRWLYRPYEVRGHRATCAGIFRRAVLEEGHRTWCHCRDDRWHCGLVLHAGAALVRRSGWLSPRSYQTGRMGSAFTHRRRCSMCTSIRCRIG